MTNEIKEILDDLLFTTTLPNVSIKLNKEKINQLEDYITNLQEENEHLKEYYLKNVSKYEELIEKYSNLQERINKAIEYINDMCLFDDGYANYGDDLRPAHIVNILKGEDE